MELLIINCQTGRIVAWFDFSEDEVFAEVLANAKAFCWANCAFACNIVLNGVILWMNR